MGWPRVASRTNCCFRLGGEGKGGDGVSLHDFFLEQFYVQLQKFVDQSLSLLKLHKKNRTIATTEDSVGPARSSGGTP